MLSPLLSLVIVLLSTEKVISTSDVQKGIDAADEIATIVGDSRVSNNFGRIVNIAQKLTSLFRAIGPAMALVRMIYPPKYIENIKKEFAEIDAKFDQVFSSLDDVKRLLVKVGLQTRYAPAEDNIIRLSSKLRDFFQQCAPPYPQHDRKRRLNGAVCRNHRIKRLVPCRC